MEITFTIPDEVAQHLAPAGDTARIAVEALALEGYRSLRLSESDVQQMLGFQTRMQVHVFLKDHDVFLNYSLAVLEQDLDTARRLRSNRESAT